MRQLRESLSPAQTVIELSLIKRIRICESTKTESNRGVSRSSDPGLATGNTLETQSGLHHTRHSHAAHSAHARHSSAHATHSAHATVVVMVVMMAVFGLLRLVDNDAVGSHQ